MNAKGVSWNMFERYDEKVRRRIFSLFSSVIDTNVKLGIIDGKRITDNFIKDIRNKKIDTWQSLQEFIDSKYFYDQCTRYAEEKIPEYKERYGLITDKGKITEGQIKYLRQLIERSVKHEDYKIRMDASNELNHILEMLTKSSGAFYIDKFKELLGYSKDNKEEIKET